MRVAVLMGGNSSEREISLKTGFAVVEGLKNSVIDVDACPYNDDIVEVLPVLLKADVVFNALHGGEGENGVISGLLQSLRIKYTGSGHETSAIAMNKHLTKLILKNNSISTPSWLHINFGNDSRIDLSQQKFSYPVVVKPNAEGSTIGVTVVQNASDLDDAIKFAGEFGTEILIEEYIPGREITVGILGDNVLPIVEIIPSHNVYDYSCKYTEGMSQYKCPADLSDNLSRRISETAKRIAILLGCRHYCRIDFRLNYEGEFFCLEVNTLPGFTSTSLVPKAAKSAGISFEELVLKIVEFAANE